MISVKNLMRSCFFNGKEVIGILIVENKINLIILRVKLFKV